MSSREKPRMPSPSGVTSPSGSGPVVRSALCAPASLSTWLLPLGSGPKTIHLRCASGFLPLLISGQPYLSFYPFIASYIAPVGTRCSYSVSSSEPTRGEFCFSDWLLIHAGSNLADVTSHKGLAIATSDHVTSVGLAYDAQGFVCIPYPF